MTIVYARTVFFETEKVAVLPNIYERVECESMNQSDKEAIFEKRPHLANVSKVFGGLSLLEYAKKNLKESSFTSLTPREEITETISELVTPRLGRTVSLQVSKYLKKYRYISTVDHHGPLTLPSFVQGNVVQAEVNKAYGESVVLVLSTGGVSLDNNSFPRGLTLHDESGKESRLPLLSLKQRHKSVLAVSAYTKKDIQRFFSQARLIFPDLPFQKIYSDKKTLSFFSYWEQVMRTNHSLFQILPLFSKMHFVTLPIEILVTELLLKYHMKKNSEIGRIFFQVSWREAYLKASDGISGAYDHATQKGTELFWRLKNGRREQLFVRGDVLRNENGDFSLKLTPKAVTKSLQKKEIFASYAICLVVVSFWGGIVCGGGYSQVDYFSELKDRYASMLQNFGEKGSAEVLKRMPTDRLGSDYHFSFEKALKTLYPMTFLDMIKGGKSFQNWMKERIDDTALSSAIENVLPDIYDILYGKHIEYTPHEQNIFNS